MFHLVLQKWNIDTVSKRRQAINEMSCECFLNFHSRVSHIRSSVTAPGKPLPRKIIPVHAVQRKTSCGTSCNPLFECCLWKQYSFNRRTNLLLLNHSNFPMKRKTTLIFWYACGSTLETLRNLPWTKVLYKYKICNWHLNDPIMISYWAEKSVLRLHAGNSPPSFLVQKEYVFIIFENNVLFRYINSEIYLRTFRFWL